MASVTAGVIAGLGSAAGSLIAGSQAGGPSQQILEKLNEFIPEGAKAAIGAQNALGLGTGGNAGILAQLQATPGYQFTQQQGIDAIQNSASAQGGVVSGNRLKNLQTFGSGLASQTYNNYISQLLGLSTIGANAAAGGTTAAGNLGTANAAGTVGATNSLLTALLGNSPSNSNAGLLSFLFNNGSGGANSNLVSPLSVAAQTAAVGN
jgi:hypothetical protein